MRVKKFWFPVFLLHVLLAGCGQTDSYRKNTVDRKGRTSSLHYPDRSAFPATPAGNNSSSEPDFLETEDSETLSPSDRPEISASLVSGVWVVDSGHSECRIATSQTVFATGFRAAPLRCFAPLDRVRFWNIKSRALLLYDEEGLILARLYQISDSLLQGSLLNGQPVSFRR